MAGHRREDWFEREEFIGQISDIRVQNLQVEREVVQKRTFTRWINLHLEKCNPPIEVHDLFQDIQDGHILMALLEELSGCKLLHGFKKSSHRIFRLNNIAKVLAFLEERNVKLVSIDAADVADGNSSIILGLIWNIILFFQIKELTGNIRSQFPSSTSLSSIPTGSDVDISNCTTSADERELVSRTMREQSKTIKKLLQWVQKRTRKYGVAVQDFGKSWTSGLAFLAVVKSIDSSLIDMRKALLRSARENLEDAFRIAHYSLGIPRLLEPEDVTINATDEHSIITYVSQFLEHFSGMEEPEESFQLIERSVSMGQLNLSTDSENRRNGAHRGRVRERSLMFQRDNVPPPPKILKSSVSEDGSALLCQFTPLAACSRSTEDFLADSTRLENISSTVVEDKKDPVIEVLITLSPNSPKLAHTESLTDFSVPDSVNTNSLLCDSAVSSPDSWTESDLGVMSGKFCESQSDGSLCDSGVIWDVYHATPVEVTPCDEGFVPPIQESDPNGQSCNNKGIYSMRSLETSQELFQGVHEKTEVEVPTEKEANHEAHNQDVALNQVLDNSKTEITEKVETKQVDLSIQGEPSFGLCVWPEVLASSGAGDLQKTDQMNQSCLSLNTEQPLPYDFRELVKQHNVEESMYIEHGCPQKTGGASSHAGQMNVPPENLNVRNNYNEFAVKIPCQKTDSPFDKKREDPRSWIVKENDEEFVETQDKPDKDDSRDSLYPQETNSTDTDGALVNTSPADQEGAPSISVISISSKPDNQTCDPERQAHARDEAVQQPETTGINGTDADVNSLQNPEEFHYDYDNSDDKNPVEISSCLIAENVKSAASEPARDMDYWYLDDKDECNKTNSTNVDKCVPYTKATKDVSDFKQECNVTLNHSQIVNTYEDLTCQTSPPDEEVQPANTVQDSARGKLSESEKTNTLQCMFNPVNSELYGRIGISCYEPLSKSKNMDDFDSDLDHSSPTEALVVDSIEPMDLFYPDKEEPIFTEPFYNEMQSWPSVLSVSALQPAPASETQQNDQPFTLVGEDLRNEVDLIQNKVITNMNEEADKASKCQEQCVLPGERIGALWDDDVPADGSDISKTTRVDPKSSNMQDSSEILPVLHHRQQPFLVESVDKWDAVTVKVARKDDDGTFWWSDSGEFYLLLVLWLVLYCFWLLPQMDLKALPSLLLSINH